MTRFVWVVTSIFIVGTPISALIWWGQGLGMRYGTVFGQEAPPGWVNGYWALWFEGVKIAFLVVAALWIVKLIFWIRNKVTQNGMNALWKPFGLNLGAANAHNENRRAKRICRERLNHDFGGATARNEKEPYTSTSYEADFIVDENGVAYPAKNSRHYSTYWPGNQTICDFGIDDSDDNDDSDNIDDFGDIDINEGAIFRKPRRPGSRPIPDWECPICHKFSIVEKPPLWGGKPRLECLACGWADMSSLFEL